MMLFGCQLLRHESTGAGEQLKLLSGVRAVTNLGHPQAVFMTSIRGRGWVYHAKGVHVLFVNNWQ